MTRNRLLVVMVLALGIHLEIPLPEEGDGWGLNFNGPALAIIIYAVWTAVVLTQVLNQLPGVFALRRPLGRVKSGFEFLWLPAVVSTLFGTGFTSSFESHSSETIRYWTFNYGSAGGSSLNLVALGVFTLLMWSLKFHATMVAANRRIATGAA